MFRQCLAAAALLTLPALAAAAPMSSSTYVMKAGASDLFEITEAKIMMSSTNPKIRDFASMMIRDHTKSTDMVKAAAMKAGMHPAPPMLDAQQKQMVAALRAARGTARDQLYISQQKTAHQMALTVQQNEASSGTAPSLKMAAAKIVPVVQMHIDHLNMM